jgi:hypothetical protein
MRGRKKMRYRGSIRNSNKPERSDARIVEESILNQKIKGPVGASLSLTDRPLRCTITHYLLSDDPFDQGFRSKEILKEFVLLLFVNLNMAVAMRGDFMPLAMNYLHHFRYPLRNISKNEEGGFDSKAVEKGKYLFNIGQDPTLASIPARRREDVFNITDVIPILHIHR